MELSPRDLSSLPSEPGCYIFKSTDENSKPKVLYVGKAKNLKNRVRQYFVNDGDPRPFVRFIKEKTSLIEYIVTKDEQDAFVLENELIKKFNPAYNVSLKDDKRYLSLRLDLKHEWPRVEIVRKIKRDKAIYMGPFSSASRLKETLNVMQKIFPLRTCPDRKLYNRSRPCIEYDIKRCVAPCVHYVTHEEYRKLVDSVVLFLEGRNQELLDQLENKMNEEAERENYEVAAHIRDQIQAITQITQNRQSVISYKQMQSGADADAFGVAQSEKRSVVFALFVRGGMVWDQRTFEFSKSGLDDREILAQVISRYYASEVYIPHEVLIPFSLDIPGLPEEVHLVVPRSQDKLSFIEIAQKNAQTRLDGLEAKSTKIEKILDQLQAKLQLKHLPATIDCLDVSHHQGSEVVASSVRFTDGFPNKDMYRRFKLSQDIVDDYASMKELIERRYKSEDELPQLLIVDGGRGQLSAAAEVLKEKNWLNLIDIIGLAKARRTQETVDPLNPMNRERIFKLGQKNPVLLAESSPEELFLTYIRDEAHRFAITYHRKRKLGSLSISILDEIPGISARTKLKLLKQFGSVDGIREASDYELLKFVKPAVLEGLRRKLSHIDMEVKNENNEKM